MNEATVTRIVAGPTPNGTNATRLAPSGYDLLDEIGRGGMGVVYRARDSALDREVAVKILQDKYAPDSGTARRFVDEARITGQLQHPGIPAVYQVGTLADGRPFLAMKLIKGQTLDELLKSGVPVDGLAITEAVGQAVGYAHAHGVIHRDLKPANIMVGAFGEVQVVDWGLAKVLGGSGPDRAPADPEATTAPTEIRTPRESDSSYTQAGSILGTPAFMAPEQAAGEVGVVDRRSDVFGLGAILCVLLTGKPPFSGRDAESVRLNAIRGKTEEAFARLDACAADPDVIALCKRCLAFEPTDRPATADEVALAVAVLRRAADDRTKQAERDKHSAEVRATEQRKRRKMLQWSAAVVVWALVGGVVASLWQAKRAMRAEYEAISKQLYAEQAQEAESVQRRRAVEAAAGEKFAKERALAKEAEANAVVKFLNDEVFAAAGSKGRSGGMAKDVTLLAAIVASLPALAKGFADQPLVEARLRVTLGITFDHVGDAGTATEQYERARAIYTERRGPEHPDTLRNMIDLSVGYLSAGRHTAGFKLLEETLATYKRVLPPDYPDTLWCMNILADCYTSFGRNADASKLHEETLAARRRALPPDHPDTLQSMTSLAYRYAALGRHGDAFKLHEEALAVHRRILPPDHPHTLLSLGHGAESLVKLNRGAEAIRLVDELVSKSAGKVFVSGMIPKLMAFRLRHFQSTNDPDGCRATAVMWEKLNRSDAGSLYDAACMRAVTSAVQAKEPGPDAARLTAEDADRAMAWLTKAVAAGYKDRLHMGWDKDLTALRGRADFQKLLDSLPAATEVAPRPRAVR